MTNTYIESIATKIEEGIGNVTSFRKKVPQEIKWIDVNFKVGDKTILNNCWGKVEAGKVCAIM